jgi:hypothetical protein
VRAIGLLLFVAGLVAAGWVTLWAVFAWAAGDPLRIVACGAATLSALALPVVFALLLERRQPGRGPDAPSPGAATRTLNRACGLFAALLFLLASPLVLWSGYVAVMSWSDGLPAASAYFAAVALATFAEPVAFLLLYDRWQTRSGLQRPRTAAR